eukprot:GILK01001788.1.p1 GENE.GILK01001788.1~~GILK01001788.1.p1  ORF type:complete len:303 (+),score=3.52 GILK01001788.1:48-911(+)
MATKRDFNGLSQYTQQTPQTHPTVQPQQQTYGYEASYVENAYKRTRVDGQQPEAAYAGYSPGHAPGTGPVAAAPYSQYGYPPAAQYPAHYATGAHAGYGPPPTQAYDYGYSRAYGPRPVGVRPTRPPAPRRQERAIYVEGIPPDATHRELAHIFRQCPGYTNLKLSWKEDKRDPNMRFVFCFVNFNTPEDAQNAIHMLHGYIFDLDDPHSSTLQIQIAKASSRSRGPGPHSDYPGSSSQSQEFTGPPGVGSQPEAEAQFPADAGRMGSQEAPFAERESQESDPRVSQ